LAHSAKAIEIEDIEARVAALEQAVASGKVRAMKTIDRRLSKLEDRLGLIKELFLAVFSDAGRHGLRIGRSMSFSTTSAPTRRR
jgi:hypothetical protein